MEQSPENLTGPQLDKTSPALYGSRRFITAFTTACHLSQYRILQTVSFHCKGNTRFFRLSFSQTDIFLRLSVPLHMSEW
jgi:hypothetical protein